MATVLLGASPEWVKINFKLFYLGHLTLTLRHSLSLQYEAKD